MTIRSGPEFILAPCTPCAIVKMITKVTILDARKHKPGTFSETGFTIVTLDEVRLFYQTRSRLGQAIYYCLLQEPGTKNWRYGSKDIHLFQEMMNPHLMKLYPKTKVVFTPYTIHAHPISKTLHFRRSCGSLMLSGAEISLETNQCKYQTK